MKYIYLSIYSLIISVFMLDTHTSFAQEQEENIDSLIQVYLKADSIFLDQLESELEGDSLTLFDLFDSLTNMDFSFSQLSLRLGYNSNVTNAGRNFGITQHGFNAGISYYHKTGLFADLSGYWDSDITPHYNPTVTSLGYMGNIVKSWSYSLSYDHYFYQTPKDDKPLYSYPLTNALNASSYFDIKFLTLAVDYSFMFGEMSTNRLRGSIIFNLQKNDFWFTDRISFMPSLSVLAGDQKIYHLYPNYKASYRKSLEQIRDIIGVQRFRQLWRDNRKLLFKMASSVLDDNMIIEEEVDDVFGIMNYSLLAPVYLYINNFTILLYYNFNIPVALPGEDLQLDPNSYFGATLIYNIPFFKL